MKIKNRNYFFLAGILIAAFVAATEMQAQDTPAASTQGAADNGTSTGSVVPRLITFSGLVKDAAGKILTGPVTLTFSLYETQDGGPPLWSETQQVQPDALGHYTVMLGATQPEGLPLDLFTSGQARWLGVLAGLPGVGELPRVLLVGVPYALKAADAETLGGKPASAYVTTPILNASGASDSAPASATPATVTAGGRTKAGPLTTCSKITADGTATANQVAKFTAACTIHQSLLFDNGTDVGINTTTPAATLDVNGNISSRDNIGLPQTTSSSLGVITLGGSPFIHACCSAASDNTFVGSSAGNFTTGTNHSTAIGFEALLSDTSGFSNTAMGADALQLNTIGFDNTAVGIAALTDNTSGNDNTAVGVDALQVDSGGGGNTAMGSFALVKNTSGGDNSASGDEALFSNTTGNFNSALGFDADVASGNLTNATAIGALSQVGESNAIVLGCIPSDCALQGISQPNVGIGTTTPGAPLEIDGLNQGDLFVKAPETGVGAGVDLFTTGSGGLQWEILDTGATSAQGANKLNIRNVNTGNDIFTILGTGAIGIETTIPDNTLTVNGSADKPGGGSWGTFSDSRLKTVDGTYDAGLDAILKLTPIRYRYKEQNAMGIKDSQQHVGFVAQEVEKVIPEAVSRNSQGYLLVNNDPILWTMLNAIKQQQAEIEKLARSERDKDAQIQKLTEEARLLQKLRHQMAGMEGRLTRVEVHSENNLAENVSVAGLTR
jgi:hypothetical protein